MRAEVGESWYGWPSFCIPETASLTVGWSDVSGRWDAAWRAQRSLARSTAVIALFTATTGPCRPVPVPLRRCPRPKRPASQRPDRQTNRRTNAAAVKIALERVQRTAPHHDDTPDKSSRALSTTIGHVLVTSLLWSFGRLGTWQWQTYRQFFYVLRCSWSSQCSW